MKIYLFFFISFGFFLFSKGIDVDVKSKAAILMNADNGFILFEKNGKKKMFPASLTKVATALFAIERAGGEVALKVSNRAIREVPPEKKHSDYKRYPPYILETDGSNFGLKKGEVWDLDSLLHMLILVSGNDSANVIAEGISGSIELFMAEMNGYLKGIGCVDTNFVNPHGLHNPLHVTTAYDVALMTKKAFEVERFRNIVSKDETVLKVCGTEKRIESYNALLDKKSRNYYPLAIGVKTGYHSRANYNLVAAAKKGGRILIAVLMGGENRDDRYMDARRLFERAFLEKKVSRLIFEKGKTFSRDKRASFAYIKEDLLYEYFPSEKREVRAFISWKEFSLPIKKGDKVGDISIISDEKEVLASASLYSVSSMEKGIFRKVLEFFKGIIK